MNENDTYLTEEQLDSLEFMAACNRIEFHDVSPNVEGEFSDRYVAVYKQFYWGSSPQGHKFWNDLSRNLVETMDFENMVD